MDFLNGLERRIGWITIPGLIRIVVLFNAVVYVLFFLNPGYVDGLTLEPQKVLSGEVWRLVSYVFIPPPAHPIFIIFALWLLWIFGEGLEQQWGSFRLTLFYLLGMLGTTIAAFLTGGASTNAYLNMTVLFAFATLFPDFTIMLFFILPVKIKWVAFISAFLTLGAIVVGDWATRFAIIVAVGNYFLFFGPEFIRSLRARQQVAERRARFESNQKSDNEPLYTCAGCGATDQTNPDLEFRVTADGQDYCSDCLAKRKAQDPST